MNSDIQVTVSGGFPFNEAGITGVAINYGYNMIPSAMLTLNVPYIMENAGGFFDNPSSFKKSTKNSMSVKIKIKSSRGCLNFTGFFDGLSIVQTPGGMEYTAIIKNKFQILTELYPKLMGMYPGSTTIGRMIPNLTYASGASALEYEALKVGAASIPANLAPTEFYLEYLKKVLDSQIDNGSYFSTTIDVSSVRELMDKTDYKNNLQLCKKLLSDVDISFAKADGYKCNRDLVYHSELMASGGDDAWTLLLNVMNESGCILLPSDEKLYVIPQSNFLKLDGSCPAVGAQSTAPNQAYPADYSNFVLNDNSYKNIKYCLVTPISGTAGNGNRNVAANLQRMGCYPTAGNDLQPDDGSSGVLLVTVPPWMGKTIQNAVFLNTKVLSANQSNAYGASGKTKELDSVDAAKQIIDDPMNMAGTLAESNEVKALLDNCAKARFLTEKYIERTGSFSLEFNPNWVPGTTGFLASRQPKALFNFYVTSVTHNISTSGGKSGSATTQINFNSARYGGSMGVIPSIEINELYGYSSGSMSGVQDMWLSDNGANYIPKRE